MRLRSSRFRRQGAAPVTLSMEAEKEVSLKVAAKRLNQARNSLSPRTGGSKYTFTQQAIQELPQGNNTPLNQVLLQAPGVAQDFSGRSTYAETMPIFNTV